MPALRVLLVDDDAWTARVVQSVLGKRGHRVYVAHDGGEARALAAEVAPDLLILEAALLTQRESSALIDSLQRRGDLPQPTSPPILVLSELPAQDERVRALSSDAYLGKPFRFLDLDRAVERTQQQARDASSAVLSDRTPGAGIHGTLDQIGLASLLTMIEMERKSGILLLRRGSQSARLYCKEGRLLAARLFGGAAPEAIAQPLTGADVVYKLLNWREGRFDFTTTAITIADEIGIRTTHLLLEGARRSDAARVQPSS